jgi:hypothetical protein
MMIILNGDEASIKEMQILLLEMELESELESEFESELESELSSEEVFHIDM